jgi:hypothetical protein
VIAAIGVLAALVARPSARAAERFLQRSGTAYAGARATTATTATTAMTGSHTTS